MKINIDFTEEEISNYLKEYISKIKRRKNRWRSFNSFEEK